MKCIIPFLFILVARCIYAESFVPIAPTTSFSMPRIQTHRAKSPKKMMNPFVSSALRQQPTITSLRGGATSLPLLGPLNALLMEHPFLACFVICGIKGFSADSVAQVTTSSKSFSLKRAFAFALYGGFYLGIGQTILYNQMFPAIFGHETTLLNTAKKVLVDMLVVLPCLTLPVSYLFKSPFYHRTLKQGIQIYIRDVKETGMLQKSWLFWAPIQFLSFTVIPEHLRVPFMTAIGFFYVIFLSSVSSDGEEEKATVVKTTINKNSVLPKVPPTKHQTQQSNDNNETHRKIVCA